MSDPNPYSYSGESSPRKDDSESKDPSAATPAMPVMVIIAATLCALMGFLGLFGSCASFAGPFFIEMAITVNEGAMENANDEERQQMDYVNQTLRTNMYIGILFGAINLFVAFGLVVGGIGTIMRQGWGARTLKISSAAAAIFVLVRFFVSIGMSYVQNFVNEEQIPEKMVETQQTGFWFSLMFSGAIMLGLLVLYVATFILLGQRATRDSLQS